FPTRRSSDLIPVYYGRYQKRKTMENYKAIQPIIELDEECRAQHFDKAAEWFRNVQLTQASFRHLLEITIEKIQEPHIKEYLSIMLSYALDHEQKSRELYTVIGRNPSVVGKITGEIVGKSRKVWADVIAGPGGATGPWQFLQQLYISNLSSMSAFAVAEQLGLALGIPEILDITFPIVSQRSADHLLLHEF